MKKAQKLVAFLAGLGLSVLMSINASADPVLVGGCLTSDFTGSTECSGIWDPGNDHGTHDIFEAAGWPYGDKATPWNHLGDINFGEGGTSGAWSVSDWGDSTSVIAVIKAGDHAAGYLMDLGITSGTWDISGANWCLESGNSGKCNNNGISHIGFWGNGTQTVPEPGSAALLLLGIVGLVLFRYKRT